MLAVMKYTPVLLFFITHAGAVITGVKDIDDVLLDGSIANMLDANVLKSKLYKWKDYGKAVERMYEKGVGDLKMWLGDMDSDQRSIQAKVDIAAFIAQSMQETIQYDACSENNWNGDNGYLMSNACGQLGQKYEDYDCEFSCPKIPQAEITAVTQAGWSGAPGPFFCAPDKKLEAKKNVKNGKTGGWNHGSPTDCGGSNVDKNLQAWERDDCQVYDGQKAGGYAWNGNGESVEGCCWWGRGVIQTTGRCNFGKLNHYAGMSHLKGSTTVPSAPSNPAYPDIDFCADPEIICRSTKYPELKWFAGLLYWVESVQNYNVGGWTYKDELRRFVDGGLKGVELIDAVSGIVNRGCHNPPCASGAVHGNDKRQSNFKAVLKAIMGSSGSGGGSPTRPTSTPSTPSSTGGTGTTNTGADTVTPPKTNNGGDCMALENSRECSHWASQGLCEGASYPSIEPKCKSYCQCFLHGSIGSSPKTTPVAPKRPSTTVTVEPKRPSTTTPVAPKRPSTVKDQNCSSVGESAACIGWAANGMCEGAFRQQIESQCKATCDCYLGRDSTQSPTPAVPQHCNECKLYCSRRRTLLEGDGSGSWPVSTIVTALSGSVLVFIVSLQFGGMLHQKLQ